MEDKEYAIVDDNSELSENKPKQKILIAGHADMGSLCLTNPQLYEQLKKIEETHDICFVDKENVIKDKDGKVIVIDDINRRGFEPIPDGLIFNNHYKDTYELHNMHQYQDDLFNPVTRKMMKEPDAVPVRNSKENPKIGRNDSCPCGSGKKNKNCCKHD